MRAKRLTEEQLLQGKTNQLAKDACANEPGLLLVDCPVECEFQIFRGNCMRKSMVSRGTNAMICEQLSSLTSWMEGPKSSRKRMCLDSRSATYCSPSTY
eukprot:673736-Amphidinium_carterae.1